MSKGYEHSDPFDYGFLSAGSIHKLYYAQFGNPKGKSALYLHGGPGSGSNPSVLRWFNPALWRIVLLDQRGAGKSIPHAEIRENTTHHLIEDNESLRKHLGLDKWSLVTGGSWGSTLGLAELENAYLAGIGSELFPQQHHQLLSYLLPGKQREDIGAFAQAYLELTSSEDEKIRLAAARNWNEWELLLSTAQHPPRVEHWKKLDDDKWSLAHTRIEAHYFLNGAWLEEGQILKDEEMQKLEGIPCTIIQGRLDFLCPPATAWEVHTKYKGSRLCLIEGAGHLPHDTQEAFEKMLEVCDEHAVNGAI